MRGRGVSWFVCQDPSDADADELTSWLRPGERVVVAGEAPLATSLGALSTSPEQLLLNIEEVAKLWQDETSRVVNEADARALVTWSEGWLLPLVLWSRDPGCASASPRSDAFMSVSSVAGFLRTRVLQPLSEPEQELLLELACSEHQDWRSFVGSRGNRRNRDAVLSRLTREVGLPMVKQGRLRLPAPLEAVLKEEALVRWGTRRVASLARSRVRVAGRHSREREPWRRSREEPDLKIKLLGTPRVERLSTDGHFDLVTWSFKRPLRVLAYLAASPGLAASREEIVSVLWRDATEDQVRRNLHPTISRLRRSLQPEGTEHGAVIRLRDGIYDLDPELRWDVDLRVFLDGLRSGRELRDRGRLEEAAKVWQESWSTYEGPFLEGMSDSWMLSRRDELQLRYVDLLRRLGDVYRRLERWSDAEDAYRSLLFEDPLEESVHVSIMTVYAARGRRDLVNRQYGRLRQLLLSELGVEPSSTTLDVYNALLT